MPSKPASIPAGPMTAGATLHQIGKADGQRHDRGCSPANSRSARRAPPAIRKTIDAILAGRGGTARVDDPASGCLMRIPDPDRRPRRRLLGADGAAHGGPVAQPASLRADAAGARRGRPHPRLRRQCLRASLRCRNPAILATVEMLVDAGSDVVGEGDDHQIGRARVATCFRQVREDVAEYLLPPRGGA